MVKFENIISLDLLKDSKDLLVPHIFSQNYFQILKAKLEGKKLNNNERYYYSHFIKKKLTAMTALLGIDTEIYVNGKEHIRKDRLKQAVNILKKYSRKHRNKKILLAGSFLYKAQYRDIDIFVISASNGVII